MAAIYKKMSGAKLDQREFDPLNYKVAVINLTFRQLIYVAIAIVLEIINLKTLKNEFIGVLIAVVCWLGGWVKMGEPPMPFFKWMKICFRFAFSQKERIYANEEIEEEGLKEKILNVPINIIEFIKNLPSLVYGVIISIKTAYTDFIYNKKEKKRKKIDEENMEE